MTSSKPKVSIAVPIHRGMQYFDFFYDRLMYSIEDQSFKDYEVVVTEEGSMPVNTNAAINKSKGELIKIFYMDDYFAHKHALKKIVDNFNIKDQWLVTGCLHQVYEPDFYEDPHSPHYPEYTSNIYTGNNRIGSPSVLTLRNNGKLLFDERLSWLLDCDLYYRLYNTYGPPKILNDLNAVIGIHKGQTSNLMSEEDKLLETQYLKHKYD